MKAEEIYTGERLLWCISIEDLGASRDNERELEVEEGPEEGGLESLSLLWSGRVTATSFMLKAPKEASGEKAFFSSSDPLPSWKEAETLVKESMDWRERPAAEATGRVLHMESAKFLEEEEPSKVLVVAPLRVPVRVNVE